MDSRNKGSAPSDIDTILVASRSETFLSLVRQATASDSMGFLAVKDVNELILELLRRRIGIVVLDVSILGDNARQAIDNLNKIRPDISAILVAGSLEEAQAMNVEVGRCVHHLFLETPSEDHLRQFILSASKIQRERPGREVEEKRERTKPTSLVT